MTARLTFPAPTRRSIRTPDGWITVPWTKRAREEYEAIGGWFITARTDMAGPEDELREEMERRGLSDA